VEKLYLKPQEQAGLYAKCCLKWCEVNRTLMTPQPVVKSRRVEFQEDSCSISSVDICLQADGKTGGRTAVLVRALEGWEEETHGYLTEASSSQSGILLLLLCLSLVIGFLFPVLFLLNQRLSSPITLPVSDCSSLRCVCGVHNIAVFCSESIEYFPGVYCYYPCYHLYAGYLQLYLKQTMFLGYIDL
jgi:hypothetical protein